MVLGRSLLGFCGDGVASKDMVRQFVLGIFPSTASDIDLALIRWLVPGVHPLNVLKDVGEEDLACVGGEVFAAVRALCHGEDGVRLVSPVVFCIHFSRSFLLNRGHL